MSMYGALVKEFGGPEVIEFVEDLPKPVIKTGKEVLIRVAACGVNPVDTYIRNGRYAALPELPYIPGRDGAGTVEKVGTEVSHVKPGDRVYFLTDKSGCAAEYCVAERVFPLPSGISLREGACLGIPYLTAFRALFLVGGLQPVTPMYPYASDYKLQRNRFETILGHLKAAPTLKTLSEYFTDFKGGAQKMDEIGQRVLIHGASGGVGLAAVQMASHFGAFVIGTAGTEEGVKAVSKNGANDIFNHANSDYLEKIVKKYPGGFDLIVEMAAHLNLQSDLELLGRSGRVAIVGSRGEVTINPRTLMMKESNVYGVMLSNSTESDLQTSTVFISNFFWLSHLRPVIHRIYPLNELNRAHADVMKEHGAKGKLIISVNDL